MQLKPSALSNLSKMICGDSPFNGIFPYRSSSYLTRFFHDIDLQYVHDGSTRFWWVQSVLQELNVNTIDNDVFPSLDMKKIIEYLVHPDHFASGIELSQEKAISILNESLKSHELKVTSDPKTGIATLYSMAETFISSSIDRQKVQKTIIFLPTVFSVPDCDIEENLVAVMMPFSAEFDKIFNSIKKACSVHNLSCFRADDIWSNSQIMQDIFELIYAARIVIVDFTGKNSNVLYETGIAHTLGKTVIPITQSIDDIPFDLKPHRALKYISNNEGQQELIEVLTKRLKTIVDGHHW